MLWEIRRGTLWIEVTTALKSSLFFYFLKLGKLFIYVLGLLLSLYVAFDILLFALFIVLSTKL